MGQGNVRGLETIFVSDLAQHQSNSLSRSQLGLPRDAKETRMFQQSTKKTRMYHRWIVTVHGLGDEKAVGILARLQCPDGSPAA
mmetsp:Transcript_16385/g.33828  ORF Transcript_16385/g.33828 Transcript_16385/m.33828 type:complete len:84 (-) Transcript_16385:41-292(-)